MNFRPCMLAKPRLNLWKQSGFVWIPVWLASSVKASGVCTKGKMGEMEEAKQEHHWAGMSREPLRPTGPYLEAEPRFLTIPSTLSPKGTSPPFILEERAFLCPALPLHT